MLVAGNHRLDERRKSLSTDMIEESQITSKMTAAEERREQVLKEKVEKVVASYPIFSMHLKCEPDRTMGLLVENVFRFHSFKTEMFRYRLQNM